jgi:zinc protease
MTRPCPRRPARLFGAVLALLLLCGLAAPARALDIQEVRSRGGITAWLVEAHGIPIVTLQAFFRGGMASDPIGKEGLANMTAALLDEGAGPLDSQAFQGRLEDLSIHLGFDAGADNFSVGLRTLKANQDEAFRLLALALRVPRFDGEAVARIRSQILASLAREAEQPRAIASRRFRAALFPGHPYGRTGEGTPESVAKIDVDDLRSFVKAHFARGNLVLAVVGDISAAELGPLLDRSFGTLPAKAAPSIVPETKPATDGKVTTVEKDVPQSTVLFGQRGPKRDDPDWYAAEVVMQILGGSTTSRLYQDVREKRGLAYSVYAGLAPLEHAGMIQGGVGTENSRVAESIARIRAEFRRMRDEGPTEAELEAAKTYLTGAFPLRFDNTSHTARLLAAIQVEHLGIDYVAKHDRLIGAVTLADAKRVARRMLDPDHLTFLVVGKPGKESPS